MNKMENLSVESAIETIRRTIKDAKRRAKTKASKQARAEFQTAMQELIVKALRLHESGRIDDLSFVEKEARKAFEITQFHCYSKRSPTDALDGFGGSKLQELYATDAGARQIVEAARNGVFERVLGKDSPYDRPIAMSIYDQGNYASIRVEGQ